MKALALAAALLAATAITPAHARLQLSISDGGTTFSCFDGQLSCDQSGGANNLLLVNATVGAAFVQIALAQSAFGAINTLQLSSSNIINKSLTPLTVTLLASDTDFVGPVRAINNSGSLTFNANIGATDSTLRFWADPANAQGANPNQTPGTLLESVFGHATTDPDSFSGSADRSVRRRRPVLDDGGRGPGAALRRLRHRLQPEHGEHRHPGAGDVGPPSRRLRRPDVRDGYTQEVA